MKHTENMLLNVQYRLPIYSYIFENNKPLETWISHGNHQTSAFMPLQYFVKHYKYGAPERWGYNMHKVRTYLSRWKRHGKKP